jgi:hypothetical protein
MSEGIGPFDMSEGICAFGGAFDSPKKNGGSQNPSNSTFSERT